MREIIISKKNRRKIIDHAVRSSPLEACGILAGLGNNIIHVYPVSNLLRSSTQFQMEPLKQLEILLKIDSLGLDMIGHYHSHPIGPESPSVTDCKVNVFPSVISLIVSGKCGEWNIAAFLMKKHTFSKINLAAVEEIKI